jgi:hypothetical protein
MTLTISLLPLGFHALATRVRHKEYWGDPETSENKLVRDVLWKGNCYYRSGDALRTDSEGRWFFLDWQTVRAAACQFLTLSPLGLTCRGTRSPISGHVQAPSSKCNNKRNQLPLKQEDVHPDRVAAEDKVLRIEPTSRSRGRIEMACMREGPSCRRQQTADVWVNYWWA